MLNFVSNLDQVGGSEVHYLLQYLAVNNNPLEDLRYRFVFCHEINQLWEYMYCQEAQTPYFKFSNLLNEHYP